MIVFDLELSGVNPNVHSILSIGAVDFSNPSRQFYAECKPWVGAKIEDEALAINGYSREELSDKPKTDEEIVKEFLSWTNECKEKTLAGQNPAIDMHFLEFACLRYGIQYPFAHRSYDLHSMIYLHMLQNDKIPPIMKSHSGLNSDNIMQYVGIPAEPKPHIAINGAVWEAEAFSRILFNKKLLPQFESYDIPWIS